MRVVEVARSAVLVLTAVLFAFVPSTARAQLVLPYAGSTSALNGDNAAFSVHSTANFAGTSTGIVVTASNASGDGSFGLFARGSTGVNAGTTTSTGWGISTSCSGTGSDFCAGIYATNNSGSSSNSVAGYFSGSTGLLVTTNYASGRGIDVTADGVSQTALRAKSNQGTAVVATATSGKCLSARNNSSANSTATIINDGYQPALEARNWDYVLGGPAVYAYSTKGTGVEAVSGSNGLNAVFGKTTSGASGVYGEGGGFGIAGRASGGGVGVFGEILSPTTGVAGLFIGRLHVNGDITATGSKQFRIDHPNDPANRYLVHAAVESPELKNLYDGNAQLGPGGEIEIVLPSYFDSLNENFRYSLTAIGSPASLYVKQRIQNGRFVVAGGSAGQEFSWQVTGTRKDANARAHPLEVEPMKPASEKGLYLSPELVSRNAQPLFKRPPTVVSSSVEAPKAHDLSTRVVPTEPR